jgi:hypothetical protein
MLEGEAGGPAGITIQPASAIDATRHRAFTS